MNELVSDYPGKELHVVLDNLNIHKPKEDRWLKANPNVHFILSPPTASGLTRLNAGLAS
jgi:hypothetical protein